MSNAYIVVEVWSSDTFGESEVFYDAPDYWDDLTLDEKKQALSDIAGTAKVNP